MTAQRTLITPVSATSTLAVLPKASGTITYDVKISVTEDAMPHHLVTLTIPGLVSPP